MPKHGSLRPRKPEGSLGRTAQGGHLDSHTQLLNYDERASRINPNVSHAQTPTCHTHKPQRTTRTNPVFHVVRVASRGFANITLFGALAPQRSFTPSHPTSRVSVRDDAETSAFDS